MNPIEGMVADARIWTVEAVYNHPASAHGTIHRLADALKAENKRAEELEHNRSTWIGDAMDVVRDVEYYRDLARRSELQCQDAERACQEARDERDMLKFELRYGAAALRDATDEWEASGDDEKLVNSAVDPWLSRVHSILSREEAP